MCNRLTLIAVALVALALATGVVAQPQTTLTVIGFVVPPHEVGTPLDQAYRRFVADFERANPGVRINAIETPPEFDTRLLVDLAAGTAPDIWAQDASSHARVWGTGELLDMRLCFDVVPSLTPDRFFAPALEIMRTPTGALMGLPNDFTPMVLFYNPEVFRGTGVPEPRTGWTWQDFLDAAQRLTLDSRGRNAKDPAFDPNNVVQWGFRVRHFTFEWIYWLWQNGGDVLSPDGRTATGYLDSPQSIEAINFLRDLMLVHRVSPTIEAQSGLLAGVEGGFLSVFLQGRYAMFPRGHWELVGLRANPHYRPERVSIIANPVGRQAATVLYQASFAAPRRVAQDRVKLEAVCKFVEAATGPGYQESKVLTGIAIPGNRNVAIRAVTQAPDPLIEQRFVNAVQFGRGPWGAKVTAYPSVETILDEMMERILRGADVRSTVTQAVTDINRQLR